MTYVAQFLKAYPEAGEDPAVSRHTTIGFHLLSQTECKLSKQKSVYLCYLLRCNQINWLRVAYCQSLFDLLNYSWDEGVRIRPHKRWMTTRTWWPGWNQKLRKFYRSWTNLWLTDNRNIWYRLLTIFLSTNTVIFSPKSLASSNNLYRHIYGVFLKGGIGMKVCF